ncbi:restriction endonuclease [Vibrio sp. LaRot3]|uniref:restriction endonuclease n=1 Tax=Vibrio sp. LaRot3 TaxID=2998829 RepID=UPI0022CE06F7|nr:restriction endonuclease [Vibrio sp. LaRot3]MDA0148170.1 restriction endonuclease [Vibrio sp. LaRot3]
MSSFYNDLYQAIYRGHNYNPQDARKYASVTWDFVDGDKVLQVKMEGFVFPLSNLGAAFIDKQMVVITHLPDSKVREFTQFLDKRIHDGSFDGYIQWIINQNWSSALEHVNRDKAELEAKNNTTNLTNPSATLTTSAEPQNVFGAAANQLGAVNGIDYEHRVASLISQNTSFNAEVTQGTGDFGVDILIRNPNNINFAVQTKLYSSNVGLSAVQQAHSGAAYYGFAQGMVITSGGFTKSAKEMADKLQVVLLNDAEIINYLNRHFP